MKNELQKMTDDISQMYEQISDKTRSLGSIATVTRLYDELQNHLQGISIEEIDKLEQQIKSTLERLLTVSKSITFLKAIKLTLDAPDDGHGSGKKS